jgi:hypothetical protein
VSGDFAVAALTIEGRGPLVSPDAECVGYGRAVLTSFERTTRSTAGLLVDPFSHLDPDPLTQTAGGRLGS